MIYCNTTYDFAAAPRVGPSLLHANYHVADVVADAGRKEHRDLQQTNKIRVIRSTEEKVNNEQGICSE